jgi:hypothetical protein
VLFPLSAGAHRLTVGGTSCLVFSTSINGPGPAGVATFIEVPVTLTASGSGWSLSVQDQPLTGALSASGSRVSGTLTGSVTIQGTRFVTGSRDGDTLSVDGSTPASGRVEGFVTAGSPTFTATNEHGSTSAICSSGGFSLRAG